MGEGEAKEHKTHMGHEEAIAIIYLEARRVVRVKNP